MKNIDYEILSLFKGNPSIELSTTDVVSLLFAEEYHVIQSTLHDTLISNDKRKQAKMHLAKLHRRALHYLSKLVQDNLLYITKTEGRGKKYFSLTIHEGEELIIDKFKRKIIVSKPPAPILPLEDFEEKKYVFKVEPDNFFERVNAILLEGDKFSDLKELYDLIYSLFTNVNDVISINDFERIIQLKEVTELLSFFEDLEEECTSYNKRISCIIDITNIESDPKIISFINTFLSKKYAHINLIFDATSREVLTHSDLFKEIVTSFASNRQKLSIKNDDVYQAPYLIGRAGPHTFSLDDWKRYIKHFQKESKGIICSQASLVADLEYFYQDYPSAKELNELIVKSARSLFFANTYQRKHSQEIFTKLQMNPSDAKIFNYSNNVIRFWNYEVFETPEENIHFLDTISEINTQIKEFSKNQETVYLSCGMPTTFKIAFSVAYRQFDKKNPLNEKFEKISLSSTNDLYSEAFRKKISVYEKAASVFDGGSEVRFNRTGNIDPLDIVREINVVMNTYRVPFFCYNFSQQLGADRKLFDYINGNY